MSVCLTGNARAPLRVRGDDLYETPDVAVHALMRVEQLPDVIWEPACGPGRIVNVLRSAGHKVYATDLVDYGCPDSLSSISAERVVLDASDAGSGIRITVPGDDDFLAIQMPCRV